MDSTFDWDDFNSEDNINIVESLLDRIYVPLAEIFAIFLKDEITDHDEYLLQLILNDSRLVVNTLVAFLIFQKITLQHLYFTFYVHICSHLVNLLKYYIVLQDNNDLLIVNVDKILAAMIVKGDLPQEINLLPRYFNRGQEKIKSPKTYNHTEAVAILWQHHIPESELQNNIEEQTIGMYVTITEEHVFTRTLKSNQSINFFRQASCGNPHYKEYYHGLEKLIIEDANQIFTKPITIKTDFRRCLKVQATDSDTKKHIERYIKSYNGKNIIILNNIRYLKVDIDDIINKKNNGDKNQACKKLNISEQCPEVTIGNNLTLGTLPKQTKSDAKKPPRATPIIAENIRCFVEYLVTTTSLNTFAKFENAMKNDYIHKANRQLTDDEKYNDALVVKNVYCVYNKETKNYYVHFSFLNNNDQLIAQEPYALLSFKQIFHKASKKIKGVTTNA